MEERTSAQYVVTVVGLLARWGVLQAIRGRFRQVRISRGPQLIVVWAWQGKNFKVLRTYAGTSLGNFGTTFGRKDTCSSGGGVPQDAWLPTYSVLGSWTNKLLVAPVGTYNKLRMLWWWTEHRRRHRDSFISHACTVCCLCLMACELAPIGLAFRSNLVDCF